MLGWKYGVMVALIDILKAVFPIVIFGLLLRMEGMELGLIRMIQYIIGSFVIIGHNFPFQMKFLGGKGTASAVGMILAVNWKIGLLSIVVFVLIAFISNYIVVGVFSMYLSFLSTTFIFDVGMTAFIITLVLFGMSIVKHRENIARIKNKTEPKLLSIF
ncbi:glycerol-3-phosphate acyltransferase [Bacillus kwashiorkori]|uniref:glycerol-3-phosphate acyltransferase n=1 Tax=Bacillus kwashiorkori TaxID=1522318 RepID=UPI00078502CB